MKKTLLLAGAALFALTTTANATETALGVGGADLSVQIHPQVDLVGTFGLTRGDELKFGVIVVPSAGFTGNETITVKPNGNAYGSNVTLLGNPNLASTSDAATQHVGGATISAGSLTVTGNIETLRATRNGASVTLKFEDTATDNTNEDPEHPTIYLKDGETLCGVISNIVLSEEITTAKEYKYGGTLALQSGQLAGKHCVGTANVTMVFNE